MVDIGMNSEAVQVPLRGKAPGPHSRRASDQRVCRALLRLALAAIQDGHDSRLPNHMTANPAIASMSNPITADIHQGGRTVRHRPLKIMTMTAVDRTGTPDVSQGSLQQRTTRQSNSDQFGARRSRLSCCSPGSWLLNASIIRPDPVSTFPLLPAADSQFSRNVLRYSSCRPLLTQRRSKSASVTFKRTTPVNSGLAPRVNHRKCPVTYWEPSTLSPRRT